MVHENELMNQANNLRASYRACISIQHITPLKIKAENNPKRCAEKRSEDPLPKFIFFHISPYAATRRVTATTWPFSRTAVGPESGA
jgi:hypothetical protein